MKLKKNVQRIKNSLKFAVRPYHNLRINAGYKRTVKYSNYLINNSIDDNLILYESFHGKNFVDSPYAIFKYLVENNEYSNFTHVWTINAGTEKEAIKKLKKYKNVKFVEVHSDEYLKCLAQAKYLINNTTFPPYFQKKEGQVYINSWHGTPLKTLGKDMKGVLGQHKNIQRNFLHCDYILNPNQFTADVIIDSHDLRGIYNGFIVNEGYPRMDLTIQADKELQKKELRKLVHFRQNKKLVLYAPTWRGEVNKVSNIKEEIYQSINELHDKLPEDYQLILKVHTLLYKHIKNDKRLKNICVPDSFETNELLSIVDVLITDYSSIFFDYLVTEKPILFYAYDKDIYEEERGFYLNLEDMPGPICYTVEDVVSNIENLHEYNDRYKEKYKTALTEYSSKDDGHATERIVDIIFKGNHTENVYKIDEPHKKNILMYCGGFLNNGITTSAINLLNNINYDEYNVSVIDKGSYDATSANNFNKLNDKVKKFYRLGSMNTTIKETYRHDLIMRKGLKNNKISAMLPKELYKREFQRMFGSAKFDVVIDFSGYVPFWTLLFATGDFQRKAIYQHNDMMAEYNKKINGKFKHRGKMNIVFPLYKEFDKVIAVAEHTRNLNVENLNQYIPKEKGVYVHNSINPEKVLEQMNNIETFNYNDNEYLLKNTINSETNLNLRGLLLPDEKNINFVNMGRLSPEKDQKKLIKSFEVISRSYDNARLYIIGEGILDKELKALVKSLRIEEKVFFTGQLSNPFSLINLCDCFVLSSNHEGQPMVLLEALILKKPIIATDIAGSRSVLKNKYGALVENNEEGLIEGLEKFIKNELNFKTFDYNSYNEEAMDMFYEEICDEVAATK